MLAAIKSLLDLFLASCADQGSLRRLRHMADQESEWIHAHDLFDSIRRKTLAAERAADHASASQYLFEETCAKSLYNLSDCSDPFDEDSPYYIIPHALVLARSLRLPDAAVTKIAAG